jgi:Cys-tRNA(Pro) deacylase
MPAMASKRFPVTGTVRTLRAAGVAFEPFLYDYHAGGTAEVAEALGVDEHLVIKTLILQDQQGRGLIMLMHGDRQVATGTLARAVGVKSLQTCDPKIAERLTGYRVGGTSPFGTRTALPIHCERSITTLPRLYINGGKRGFIVGLATSELIRVLQPVLVDAAQPIDKSSP